MDSSVYAVHVAYPYLLHSITYLTLKVPNFFTTISKLTGEELPERYIWRMCMSLVAMPLILDGVVLHRALSFEAGVLQRWWLRMLNTTVLLLHFMQMYLLLSVTYLSSKEHMGEDHISVQHQL